MRALKNFSKRERLRAHWHTLPGGYPTLRKVFSCGVLKLSPLRSTHQRKTPAAQPVVQGVDEGRSREKVSWASMNAAHTSRVRRDEVAASSSTELEEVVMRSGHGRNNIVFMAGFWVAAPQGWFRTVVVRSARVDQRGGESTVYLIDRGRPP